MLSPLFNVSSNSSLRLTALAIPFPHPCASASRRLCSLSCLLHPRLLMRQLLFRRYLLPGISINSRRRCIVPDVLQYCPVCYWLAVPITRQSLGSQEGDAVMCCSVITTHSRNQLHHHSSPLSQNERIQSVQMLSGLQPSVSVECRSMSQLLQSLV